jgi:pimeloyl-ACP methyl ester carboxylesterase
MKSVLTFILIFISLVIHAQVPYGNNPAAGKFENVNGIAMYYETYGSGVPLLLIHGNGGNIASMKNQIPYFSKYFKVIVADSREHGKSNSDGKRLTYENMALDYKMLVEKLKLDSVYIVGWSDGGIISLLMAIDMGDKVKRIAAMGANLRPDSTAVHGWGVRWVKKGKNSIEAQMKTGDTSRPYGYYLRLYDLLGKQPNIKTDDLHRIKAFSLIMCGDRDVIKEEHTAEIFHHIPKAQLCVFPGATHMIPEEDPETFNNAVLKFFQSPFKRPDTKSYFN